MAKQNPINIAVSMDTHAWLCSKKDKSKSFDAIIKELIESQASTNEFISNQDKSYIIPGMGGGVNMNFDVGKLMAKKQKGEAIADFAFGIGFAILIIVLIYYVVLQFVPLMKAGASAAVNGTIDNLTNAFTTFGIFVPIIVLVGLASMALAYLRSGFGGQRQGM